MLQLLEDIQREIDSVTEAELAKMARTLTPPCKHDIVLGHIHNLEAQKLYTLIRRWDANTDKASHVFKYEADTPEEREMANQEAQKANTMKLTVEALFWHQVRLDIGGSAWTAESVGIRSGFAMICRKPNKHGVGGGQTPNPLALGSGLSALSALFGLGPTVSLSGPFGIQPPEDEEEPDGK